jgi:transcriptional regulator with XRE-family HTH domain
MINVGGRIKKIRVGKKMTIDDLAGRCDLSKSYVSQIENSKVSPSLRSLEKIADAFEVPMVKFFQSDSVELYVLRQDERQVILFPPRDGDSKNSKILKFLSAPNRQIEMVIAELPPGYNIDGPLHYHEGEECHLILEGTVRAIQEDNVVTLDAGDSYHWDGSIPHRIENVGQTTAKMLIASNIPGFLSQRHYVGEEKGEPKFDATDTPVETPEVRHSKNIF